MKNLILLLTLVTAGQFLSAQYCGNFGPGICTPSGTSPVGFSPLPGQTPPLVNSQSPPVLLQFTNWDRISFRGTIFTVRSVGFDSIINLAGWICWTTNKASDSFANSEHGCLVLNGTTSAAPSQYRLGLYVSWTAALRPINNKSVGWQA